jgi:hypothetical protein
MYSEVGQTENNTHNEEGSNIIFDFHFILSSVLMSISTYF